MLKILKRADV